MEITVAAERMLVFTPTVSPDEAEQIALSKKIDAFGTISKMASFLSRPKDDEFEIVYREHRFVPYWHIASTSHYEYERTVQHSWPVSGAEVKQITIDQQEYTCVDGKVTVETKEYCREEHHKELFVDSLTGKQSSELAAYQTYPFTVVDKKIMDDYAQKAIIVVPPKSRASAIVNDVLASLIHSVEADRVFEERVDLERVDLCYRPVHAFQFRWKTKNKEAVVEVDALTGKVSYGDQLFKQYLGKALDPEFLFDIGADAAGMFLPGGSIAVKMAKKYLTMKHST